jgi:hypothetical protein
MAATAINEAQTKPAVDGPTPMTAARPESGNGSDQERKKTFWAGKVKQRRRFGAVKSWKPERVFEGLLNSRVGRSGDQREIESAE